MNSQNEKALEQKPQSVGFLGKAKIRGTLHFHLKDGSTVTKDFVGTVDSVKKETKDDDLGS